MLAGPKLIKISKRAKGFVPLGARKRSFPTGFTFIEIIMVVVIIGILALIARPRFKTYYSLKLNNAAKKIISDMRYSQSLAVSRHQAYEIAFDEAAEQYQVYRVSDRQLAKDPFTRQDLIVDFQVDSQYKGVDISGVDFGGAEVLRFNWEGIPQDQGGTDLSSDGSLELHYGNRVLTIIVTSQTGSVALQ